MRLFEAEKLRLVRFYELGDSLFLQEVKDGYPLLRAAGNNGASATINVLQNYSVTEQADIVRLLAMMSHQHALRILGISMSADDSAKLKEFIDLRNNEGRRLAFEAKTDWDKLFALKSSAIKREVARRDLMQFGKRIATTNFDFGYTMDIGDWVLSTFIVAKTRMGPEIDYEHVIKFKSGDLTLEEDRQLPGHAFELHRRTGIPSILSRITRSCELQSADQLPSRVDGLIYTWERFYDRVVPMLEAIRL